MFFDEQRKETQTYRFLWRYFEQRLSFSPIDDLLMTTRMSPPSLAREYECG